MGVANLLVELFVEELPPKALKGLGQAWSELIKDGLLSRGLIGADARTRDFASPRRLGVHISDVLAQAPDLAQVHKLMPVSVGLDAQGKATPALLKKLQSLGLGEEALGRLSQRDDGKAKALFIDVTKKGLDLREGLQQALHEAVAKLPIPKLMSYQLHEGQLSPGGDAVPPRAGWTNVHFVRPAHGLVALHGDAVVDVNVLGLRAQRHTHGHRFESSTPLITLAHADAYEATLAEQGAVMANFELRRAEIARQLQAQALAAGANLVPVDDDALLDEVTALVERPNVLIGAFDADFLQVPQECLILTMKANQKYFPLLDLSAGTPARLSNRFLIVSNISPQDPGEVVRGNERVVRPRLADARFFFEQDKKRPLLSRREALGKVVYHNKLGTQGQRSERVASLSQAIVDQWCQANLAAPHAPALAPELLAWTRSAAELAKCDLLTDMVGEFPELQGVMGAYYARHEGLPEAVAVAIEDHYKPRFAGDELPRHDAALALALADKLETLVGMFGIGQLPTGDRDPFALRRHALGVIRILMERDLPLSLPQLIASAVRVMGDLISDPSQALLGFFMDRLAVVLREQGYRAQEVDAVLAMAPACLGDIPRRLDAVRRFAALPQAQSLAAANKRVGNILKKSAQAPEARVREDLLVDAAERALYQELGRVAPLAHHAFAQGDYTASLSALADLKVAVDAFFEDVMVNADDPQLRANRLGLLATLHLAMNQVADLSRLAA